MILFIYLFDMYAVEMGDTQRLLSQFLMKYYLEYRVQHDGWGTKDKEAFVGICNKRNIEYHESISDDIYWDSADDMAKYFRTLAQHFLRNVHSKGYSDAFAISSVVTNLKFYWDFAANIIQAGLGRKR